MAFVLITGPTVEPVSTAEAKLHLRVDVADDDALIGALIKAGREFVEQRTRRALITQTWDLWMDAWPEDSEIRLMAPLQSVSYVHTVDSDGGTATWAASNYLVDTVRQPGRIVRKSAASWPSTTLQEVNGVNVRFVAGYGSAGTAVPQPLRQAVLMAVGHWYENREAIATTGAMPKELPLAVDALTWPYRVLEF
jgi:uncharacterized phiE125 gp8 family phage protein